MLAEARAVGVVQLVTKGNAALAYGFAAFTNDVWPGAATGAESWLERKHAEIVVPAKQRTQMLGAVRAPPGPLERGEDEGLKVEILHAMPPTVPSWLVCRLRCLFHQPAAFAVAAGVLGKDVIFCDGLDGCLVDELL